MDLERDKWPDPVKRIKDEMDMHAAAHMSGADCAGDYVVFSMQDGRPVTHDTYPSRARARQAGEKITGDNLLILEISPDGMPFNEADAVLRYERTLNNIGARTPDHMESEQNSGALSMPHNRHDRRRMAAQLKKGRPLYPVDQPYSNLFNLQKKD